jgi:hypothetical protein
MPEACLYDINSVPKLSKPDLSWVVQLLNYFLHNNLVSSGKNMALTKVFLNYLFKYGFRTKSILNLEKKISDASVLHRIARMSNNMWHVALLQIYSSSPRRRPTTRTSSTRCPFCQSSFQPKGFRSDS